MKRWLFIFVSATSLLLCILTVVLWVRSYRASDFVWSPDGANVLHIVTGRGDMLLQWVSNKPRSAWGRGGWGHARNPPQDIVSGNWRFWTQSQPRKLLWLITWGRAIYGRGGSSGSGFSVMFPYWLVTVLTLAAPATALGKRFASRRKHRAGLCPICGYDLRATPERCPECGTGAAEIHT
jgi:hypothetical protein